MIWKTAQCTYPRTWPELKKAIQEQYGGADDLQDPVGMLYSQQQTVTETMNSYFF